MSNHEIEDVLSSIRRLVSEDLRPVARPAAPQVVPPAAPEAADKLLLTPAFRVVPPQPAPEAAFAAVPDAPPMAKAAAPAEVLRAEPDADAALTPLSLDAAPAASEPVAAVQTDAEAPADWPLPAYLLAETVEASLPERMPDPAPEATAAVPSTVAPAVVDHVVSFLSAADADADWESPTGDPEVWDSAASRPEPVFVHHKRRLPVEDFVLDLGAAPIAGAPAEETEELAAPPAAVAPEAQSAARPRIIRTVDLPPEPQPEPEPVQGAPESVYDADQAAGDDDWADAAEAAAIADLEQHTEEEVMARFAPEEEGMVFDEEVLRELVRDLIREELAGTLGERITRNVRKLVRAEIARALALREFE